MKLATEQRICHTIGCSGPLMQYEWMPLWICNIAMRICGWATDRVTG